MGVRAVSYTHLDVYKRQEYGVMSMPALVVNDRVVSAGKVLKPADVESLLHHAGL